MPMHYAGIGCDMDPILDIAAAHGLPVIEDAAQGVNAFYKDRPLGGLGSLGAYSFHNTKNFICGEGGALCINDQRYEEAAHVFRDKGSNRRAMRLGYVDKYTWVGKGSAEAMGELPAAFLLAQLEAMDAITERRGRLFRRYGEGLKPLADAGHLQLPV